MAFANLTAPRDTGRKEGKLIALPMAEETIYKGSLVYIEAGNLTVDAGSFFPFAGVASETKTCDSAGDVKLNVFASGVFEFNAATGLTLAAGDVGKVAYADSLAAGAGNPGKIILEAPADFDCKVGRIVKVISASKCLVRIDGYALREICAED